MIGSIWKKPSKDSGDKGTSSATQTLKRATTIPPPSLRRDTPR
jgi:hypothetical protein